MEAPVERTNEKPYEGEEIAEKVPVIALGESAIKNASPRPLPPYYPDISLAMAEQFNAALKGAKSPKRRRGPAHAMDPPPLGQFSEPRMGRRTLQGRPGRVVQRGTVITYNAGQEAHVEVVAGRWAQVPATGERLR